MRQTPLTRLRENYPAVVKDLLGSLVELLQAAHEACEGDLEKFLILSLIALRTVEHKDFGKLDFAAIGRGEVAVLPSLYSNVRSIADAHVEWLNADEVQALLKKIATGVRPVHFGPSQGATTKP